jgi:hypothetical protein
MDFRAPASLLLLAFSGEVLAAENSPPNQASENPSTASIGMARMLPDGTILIGVASGGSGDRAQAVMQLKPGDTQYQPVLDHIGGLKPGETKPIPPWPEPPPQHSTEAPPPAPADK